MLKKLGVMAVMAGATAVVSLPAVAGDTNNALGGALGGVAVAASAMRSAAARARSSAAR